jgi:hypothetical protein
MRVITPSTERVYLNIFGTCLGVDSNGDGRLLEGTAQLFDYFQKKDIPFFLVSEVEDEHVFRALFTGAAEADTERYDLFNRLILPSVGMIGTGFAQFPDIALFHERRGESLRYGVPFIGRADTYAKKIDGAAATHAQAYFIPHKPGASLADLLPRD